MASARRHDTNCGVGGGGGGGGPAPPPPPPPGRVGGLSSGFGIPARHRRAAR
ncbi:MAG: hypothetical protein VB141_08025 [Burkholderia gladioli]